MIERERNRNGSLTKGLKFLCRHRWWMYSILYLRESKNTYIHTHRWMKRNVYVRSLSQSTIRWCPLFYIYIYICIYIYTYILSLSPFRLLRYCAWVKNVCVLRSKEKKRNLKRRNTTLYTFSCFSFFYFACLTNEKKKSKNTHIYIYVYIYIYI